MRPACEYLKKGSARKCWARENENEWDKPPRQQQQQQPPKTSSSVPAHISSSFSSEKRRLGVIYRLLHSSKESKELEELLGDKRERLAMRQSKLEINKKKKKSQGNVLLAMFLNLDSFNNIIIQKYNISNCLIQYTQMESAVDSCKIDTIGLKKKRSAATVWQ